MIDLNTYSKTKPLFDYLRKKRENVRFAKTIELTATFFLICFFLFFAIKPTFFTISSLVGEIKSKEILASKMQQKINQVVQAQDAFAQVQLNYRIIDSCLPESPRYTHSASQLQLSASQYSLPLITLDYDLELDNDNRNSKINPNLRSYRTTFNFPSNFSSALNFISRILQNRRLMDFEKISLSSAVFDQKQSETLSPTDILTNYQATIYYWQQPDKGNAKN